MAINKNNDLQHVISLLESKVDFLETQLNEIDRLLKNSGFANGIETLKETLVELMAEDEEFRAQEKDRSDLL